LVLANPSHLNPPPSRRVRNKRYGSRCSWRLKTGRPGGFFEEIEKMPFCDKGDLSGGPRELLFLFPFFLPTPLCLVFFSFFFFLFFSPFFPLSFPACLLFLSHAIFEGRAACPALRTVLEPDGLPSLKSRVLAERRNLKRRRPKELGTPRDPAPPGKFFCRAGNSFRTLCPSFPYILGSLVVRLKTRQGAQSSE